MRIYKVKRLLFCLSVIFLTTACTEDSDDGSGISPSPIMLDEQSLDTSTDENGIATFNFTVAGDISAFQLLVFPSTNRVKLLTLQNSQGPVSLAPLTNAFRSAITSQDSVNTLNYPFGPFDLQSGNYSATYQLFDSSGFRNAPFTELSAKLLSKRDSDLSRGSVGVNVVLVGPVGGSDETRESLEAVMAEAAGILSGANLALNIEWSSYPGTNLIPDPRGTDPFYENLSNAMRPNSINLVFGTDLLGLQAPNSYYSVSTGDGGPAIPTKRSAAALSIIQLAGGDGRFNFDGDGGVQQHGNEITFSGEEVAQLIAHYLGVSHIVESDGNRTTSIDALSDTNSCLTLTDCREEQGIRENLMFPFPIVILRDNLATYPRTRITEQQRATLQRSVLVN